LTAFCLVSKIQQVQVFHEEQQLNNHHDETNQSSKWQERIWILAVAGQAGFLIAIPVLLGFGVGILLDRQFNTIILFAVLLAMAGFGGGEFLVYRGVKGTVHKRLEEQKKEE
jgi:F0F1-type ATP synthase assembly protein I